MLTSFPDAPPAPKDDIPEVQVPDTLKTALAATVPAAPEAQTGLEDPFPAHEALLQGFCQHLQKILERNVFEHHKVVMEALNSVCDTVRRWSEGTLQVNEHAAYQLSDALLKLQQDGLQVRHAPYEATLHGQTPSGVAITITVRKQDCDALIDEVTAVEGWLASKVSPGR
jgi:hypothetical protein